MKALLITTGHNSSAILVEDNQVKWGIETERISGIKSDSTFPRQVIERMMGHKGHHDVDAVYVTHWEPNGSLRSVKEKYFDWSFFPGIPIRTLNPDLDHHDTHALAALRFAGRDFPANAHVLVVDGFGNYGEHLSIYTADPAAGSLTLKKRLYGYNSSLGLFYQYMTAFMGLKMHQDEYKLLGYEVHVTEEIRDKLATAIRGTAEEFVIDGMSSSYLQPDDPVLNVNALPQTKDKVFQRASDVMNLLGLTDSNSWEARCALAYFAQGVLEQCVLSWIMAYDMKNVILSGGCFYNVKLNCRIIEQIQGKVCVYPLCGDQGNALGLYAHDNPSFIFPSHLKWGMRNLQINGMVNGLETNGSWDDVEQELGMHGIVNVVRGNMEFGPRALCNTSTLALPTIENVKKINSANNRSTVMPMAPVVTRDWYHHNFAYTDKVWRSEKFMITALPFNGQQDITTVRGAAHHYGSSGSAFNFTGRPQVIDQFDDPDLYDLVDKCGGILLNTSFNYHGKPIVYDQPSLIESHQLQFNNGGFKTVVMP